MLHEKDHGVLEDMMDRGNGSSEQSRAPKSTCPCFLSQTRHNMLLFCLKHAPPIPYHNLNTQPAFPNISLTPIRLSAWLLPHHVHTLHVSPPCLACSPSTLCTLQHALLHATHPRYDSQPRVLPGLHSMLDLQASVMCCPSNNSSMLHLQCCS